MKRLLCLLLLLQTAAPAATVLLKAGFEDETTENFGSDFPGAALTVTDYDFSTGKFALKAAGGPVIDVERYIHYTDQDTKVGFHYKAHGLRTIRVLGGCVDVKENLYFNLTNVTQDAWCWARVRVADFRNVIPSQGGPECPFGDTTGAGRTFRCLVFHLMDPDKKVEDTAVYLDNIVLYSGSDTTPPTRPGAPQVHADAKGAFLAWPESKDDVGVACYRVFKGAAADFEPAGEPMATCVAPECPIPDPQAWYRVVAVDYDGNASAAGPAAGGNNKK